MHDKKILIRDRPVSGLDVEDMFASVDKEYRRRDLKQNAHQAPRRPYSRQHKTHHQHFKWSYYINQSRKKG